MSERAHSPAQQDVLIYDGDCGVCQWAASWLKRRDKAHRMAILPFQEIDPADYWPGLTVQECARVVQFISAEGRRFTAARAMFEALRRLPFPWSWLAALLIPFSPVFEPLYALFARHRFRVSAWLGLDACRPR